MYGINVYTSDGDKLNTNNLGNYLSIFRVIPQSELKWANSTTLTSNEIAVQLPPIGPYDKVSVYTFYSNSELYDDEWKVRFVSSSGILTAYIKMVAKSSSRRASNASHAVFAKTTFN